jgi:hypothetical protein
MKKLLVGLFALGSISSFAQCSVNFNHLKAKNLSTDVREALIDKGYTLLNNRKKMRSADFKIIIDYKAFPYSLYSFRGRVVHVSGFETKFSIRGDQESTTVIHDINKQILKRADLANTVAERKLILSEIDNELNHTIAGVPAYIGLLSQINTCDQYLGEK